MLFFSIYNRKMYDKHTLIKTVIVTEQELDKLFKDQNDKINNIINELENNVDQSITSAFKEKSFDL